MSARETWNALRTPTIKDHGCGNCRYLHMRHLVNSCLGDVGVGVNVRCQENKNDLTGAVLEGWKWDKVNPTWL